MGWDDVSTAMRGRDILVRMMEGVVNRLRPEPRLARVESIDRNTYKAMVRFAGDSVNLRVSFSRGMQPRAIGDVVRVAGRLGNYYITEVQGSAFYHEIYENNPGVGGNGTGAGAWQLDTFTCAGNAEVFNLTYVPVDQSEDVKVNGLGQQSTDWARDGNVLSVVDGVTFAGDVMTCHYQYVGYLVPTPDEPDPEQLTDLVLRNSSYSRDATISSLALPSGTQIGDLIIIGVGNATVSDSRVTEIASSPDNLRRAYVGTATTLDSLTVSQPGAYSIIGVATFEPPAAATGDGVATAILTNPSTTTTQPVADAYAAVAVNVSNHGLVDGNSGAPAGYSEVLGPGPGKWCAEISQWFDADATNSPAGSVTFTGSFNVNGEALLVTIPVGLGALPVTPDTGTGRLGVYDGTPAETPIEHCEADFGAPPDITSAYLQAGTLPGTSYYEDALAAGIDLNLTRTAKGTQHLAGIANGNAASLAWMNDWVDWCQALAEAYPARTIYITLDHEAKVKVRRGELTGDSANPTVIGQALAKLYEEVQSRGVANLLTTYWFVGSDRAFEGEIGQSFHNEGFDPDFIVWDPYGSSATATIHSIVSTDKAWIFDQDWYDGQPLALGEFGLPVEFGDAALEAFYTDARTAIEAEGLAWAIFFNRLKDNNHKITVKRADGSYIYPRAVAAFSGSLQGG